LETRRAFSYSANAPAIWRIIFRVGSSLAVNQSFAKYCGLDIVAEYYDQAVSDADPIEGRPGFKALLDRIVGNGVKTVVVEDASRFAGTLMVQEAGIGMLVGLGRPRADLARRRPNP
jgi:phosphoglycolate phosphatase-like HAD superfamily hydrolase